MKDYIDKSLMDLFDVNLLLEVYKIMDMTIPKEATKLFYEEKLTSSFQAW